MHILRIAFPALCVLCYPGTVWAQAGPEVLTLERCIALALEQNPLILSAVQRHEASLARIDQVTAFPEPSIDFNSDLQPQLFNFKNSGESYIGASQTIEFPGKRSLRGEIAARESNETGTDVDFLRLEIAFQVKEAYYGLLLAKEQSTYAERDLELSNDYLNKAQVKHTAGDVARVEVLRARVEALKAANALKVAENEESLAKARLNFVLGRRKSAPVDVAGNLKRAFVHLDLEALKREAFSSRPELRRLGYSLDREALLTRQSRLSNWPDFDFGLSRHRIQGEDSSWSFTVSVPLPFLFKKRQNAEIAEAHANARSLKRETEHFQDLISLEVEEAYMNSLTARDQIELFEAEILPQAEEVHNMFLFSYQEGEIGGIELIEARRTLNEARRAYADALFAYAATQASLEKALGRLP